MELQAKVSFATESPLDAAAALGDAGDVLAELFLYLARPGHELEAEAVVDHGEAAGGERQALTIGAAHMLAGRGLHVRQSRLGRDHCTHRVQFASTQGVQEIALHDDALTLPPGEPFACKMFGTSLHGVARLATKPAHGERHGIALNEAMVDPGRAGSGDLLVEVEIAAVGEHQRRAPVVRPPKAADLDDPS